jgi:hypothetical protein
VLASGATSIRAASDEQVARCETFAARAVPGDWPRIEQREGFVLFIPPSCAADPGMPRFVHGGSRWRCGTVGVEVVWGMWGVGTAGEAAGDGAKACGATLSGVRVVASTPGKEHRRAVWYRTGGVHEPLVVAWSSVATDVPTLEAITRSGTMKPTGR